MGENGVRADDSRRNEPTAFRVDRQNRPLFLPDSTCILPIIDRPRLDEVCTASRSRFIYLDPMLSSSLPERKPEGCRDQKWWGWPSDRGILYVWRSEREPMRTATTGLAARAGGGDGRASGGAPLGAPAPEGEEAYAAFLAYRDLGPSRYPRGDAERLGKRPGLPQADRAVVGPARLAQRAGAWDDHLQAERDKVAAEEAAKWERRRLQALEEGWQTCRALRARLEQMLAIPPETPAVAPPEPAREMPEALPDAVATPEAAEASRRGRGPTRWNDLDGGAAGEAGRRAGVGPPGRGLAARREIDPLTATDEEIKAYLALNPRFGRPPPAEPAHLTSRGGPTSGQPAARARPGLP